MNEPPPPMPSRRRIPKWLWPAMAAAVLSFLFALVLLNREIQRARAVRDMRDPLYSPASNQESGAIPRNAR